MLTTRWNSSQSMSVSIPSVMPAAYPATRRLRARNGQPRLVGGDHVSFSRVGVEELFQYGGQHVGFDHVGLAVEGAVFGVGEDAGQVAGAVADPGRALAAVDDQGRHLDAVPPSLRQRPALRELGQDRKSTRLNS